MRISDIRLLDRQYIKSHNDDNIKYNLCGKFVWKELSYFIVWICLKLKLSANQVTGSSLLIGLFGCLALSSGIHILMILGAILINLWALLDYVDGQLARYNKTSSNYGRFIDNLADTAMAGTIFISLGIGIWNMSEEAIYIVLGGFASISYLYLLLISYNYERLITPDLTAFVSNIKAKGIPNGIIQFLGFNFCNVTGILTPVILLGVIYNTLPIVIILWTIINLGAVYFMSYSMIKKARQIVK